MARTEYGTTWWGKQWLSALSNIDYENRIPRGKSYANTGKVLSVKIDPARRVIKARVKGHYDPYYRVRIKLPSFSENQVKKLIKQIANSPLVLVKLASRQLDPKVLNICEKLGIHLFPTSWHDLEMECSCPDYAVPCKHIAAVMYVLSKEIDSNPFILFTLRGIDLIKELEKEGIHIKRAKKAELPSWQNLLTRQNPIEQAQKTDAFDVSTPEGRASWLENLNKLTFAKFNFDPESILKVLPEKPAGYIHGDLRALTGKVMREAGKIADQQIRNISERTAPTFSGEHEMICVNTWGQTRVSEALSWQEYDLGKKGLVQRYVGAKREDGTQVYYHEMFSGFLNHKRLSSTPETIEALYDAWMIASKLVAAGAIVPTIYQPVPECFAVKWVPAVSEQMIGELVGRLGFLLKGLDPKEFEILKAPEAVDNQVLGEIVLGGFIQSYIEKAFSTLIGTGKDIYEQAALFGGEFIDVEDDPEASASRLRLTDWLSSLTIAREELRPVLTIKDLIADENKAETTKEAFERSISIELGFNLEQSKGRQKSLDYFTFKDFMTKEELGQYKFDAMKISSKLSDHCPELYALLRDTRAQTQLTMEELTPLVFDSLPALSLLGVSLVLPKSLQTLLKPAVKLELELPEEWEESTGLLGLASLLDFDWKMAVGNRKISQQEESELFKQAGKIVRFHDEFLFVDPVQIAQIKKKLAGKNTELNTMGLIRAILSGHTEDSDVVLGESVKKALAKLFKDSEAPLPATINAKLRDYQERGYRWMLRNMKIGVGSILADDMGLGKTLQVLSVLESMRSRDEFKNRPALVVVPTTLLTNWIREAQKFTPQLKILPFYGPQRVFQEDADVILTTYGTLRRAPEIKKKEFKLLVLDEAQAIKNHKTSTWKTVRGLKADHCIAMSGTPVENRLLEYWAIMEAANPGLLGVERKFKKEYADPIEVSHNQAVADQFKRLTEPFILRRLKSDKSIIKDLPDKIVKDDYCVLTPEQAALYQETVDKNLALINEGMDRFERSALVIQMIMQLKQICNAPIQFEKSSPFKGPEYSGKMERLFAILDDLFEADKKVLIFTQFRQMGHLLEQWLKERYGEEPQFIHGGLSVKQRQELVDSFQNDRSRRMMILSLKAAGTGLNLTAASAVIHFDLWWNPAVENQATDRAYRIGQKKNVTVYRFITANSFEEKINTLIESKKALAEMTVATGEHWITELDNKQLEEIFTLSENLSAQ
ncbi:DEAD/DEAH box helicase [Turicimonas muris]|uniref:Helicase SNF2 n=2 Tax=Turicimonas muris TaxID=1796652 RepID=A0A227K9W0_9BURK|nr:DEAD/DEAH box helicase [Turicimonas muris]ANU67229.1 hypothetical protein A4V04_12915 [Burkholderiales bacterium YL45]OXE44094.1 hypothetical protein ADH67_13110 [Turicimonas muris]QQQ96084.1 DEAD/DEAH box helicase [Turicimonas muris]